MQYTQANLTEIDAMYQRVAIANSISKNIFEFNDDGLLLFSRAIAKEILKLTRPEESSDDIFILELCHAIDEVSKYENNVQLFGTPWFANSAMFLNILNSMIQSVK